MDATEAKHWGLANHVVPKGQSLAKAREIAKQLASGPPLLFPAIKQLLRHTEMVSEHESFELHDALSAVQKVLRSDRSVGRRPGLLREARAELDGEIAATTGTQDAPHAQRKSAQRARSTAATTPSETPHSAAPSSSHSPRRRITPRSSSRVGKSAQTGWPPRTRPRYTTSSHPALPPSGVSETSAL